MWATAAAVAAEMATVAQDPFGELCTPLAQRPGRRRLTQCTARSARCQLTCTHSKHFLRAACRAKHRKSTRTRRPPHRPARTLAPCPGSYKQVPTDCCQQRPGSNRYPQQPIGRWLAAGTVVEAWTAAARATVAVREVRAARAVVPRAHSSPCSHSPFGRTGRTCSTRNMYHTSVRHTVHRTGVGGVAARAAMAARTAAAASRQGQTLARQPPPLARRAPTTPPHMPAHSRRRAGAARPQPPTRLGCEPLP